MLRTVKSAFRKLEIASGFDRWVVRTLPHGVRRKLVPPSTYYADRLANYTVDGIRWRINASTLIEHMILRGECSPTIELALKSLKSGPTTILDVGANIGQFALPLALRVHDRTVIHSFEPNPNVFSVLQEHIDANGLKDRVIPWPVGLGNSECDLRLSVPERNLGAGSLTRNYQHEDSKIYSVRIGTLDNFMLKNRLPPVSFIKVDVEGFEKQFIDGATETLARNRPILFVETDDANLSYIRSKLEPFGYGQPTRMGIDVLFTSSRAA